MIMEILEWGGAVLLGLGVWKLGSKKASNPLQRLRGFIICNVRSLMLFIMTLMTGFFGLMFVQIAGILNNFRGIYNTTKEIKHLKIEK